MRTKEEFVVVSEEVARRIAPLSALELSEFTPAELEAAVVKEFVDELSPLLEIPV